MCCMSDKAVLRLEKRDAHWVLAGTDANKFDLVGEYLSHLFDRNYSPLTVGSYGGMTCSRSAGGSSSVMLE